MEQEIARMQRLRADGYNDKEIGRLHGMSVTKVIKLIGIKPKKLYTVKENTGTLQELCKIYDIRRVTVSTRLWNGYTIEEAFTKPVKKRKG